MHPDKLDHIADALWRASDGHLDLLDAARRRKPTLTRPP